MNGSAVLTQSALSSQHVDHVLDRTGSGQIPDRGVFIGVDTHQLTHHAAVIDPHHARLAHREFPATATGYRDLSRWAGSHGRVLGIGVESTGSYGAGLTRHLLTTMPGVEIFEVSRPERTTRAKEGKSDPIDAYSAAVQVVSRRTQARPKITTGLVEAIRVVKVPRDLAVKDRTAAYSQMRDLITTGPEHLRQELIGLTSRGRVTRALTLRPDPTRLHEPLQATKQALRALARRIRDLDAEIDEADKILTALTKQACPTVLAMPGVGTQSAAQLVITAGQNIDRMRTEAAFAKFCGTAPLPASSGKTNRHRLNRGGDRAANSALYMIIVGRMSRDPRTRAYVERRRAQGMTTPEIIRCLKRHLARNIYNTLKHDLMTP